MEWLQTWGLPLLVGGIFLITGLITMKFPPKKINGLYGYRTKNSMKSQERWDLAQRTASNLMIRYGVIMLVSSPIFTIVEVQPWVQSTFSIALLILLSGLLILKTEKTLKNSFDD